MMDSNVKGGSFCWVSFLSSKIKYSICRMLLFKNQLCINEDFGSLRFFWFKKKPWACSSEEEVSPFDRLLFTFLWAFTLLFWLGQKRDALNPHTTCQLKRISSTALTSRCHKCHERVLSQKNFGPKKNSLSCWCSNSFRYTCKPNWSTTFWNWAIIIIASFTKYYLNLCLFPNIIYA